jgi:hypothetical protein
MICILKNKVAKTTNMILKMVERTMLDKLQDVARCWEPLPSLHATDISINPLSLFFVGVANTILCRLKAMHPISLSQASSSTCGHSESLVRESKSGIEFSYEDLILVFVSNKVFVSSMHMNRRG